MNPLAPIPAPVLPASSGAAASPPPAAPHAPRPAAPNITQQALPPLAGTEAARGLDRQLERAAALAHRGREVAVETRRDEATGRIVVTVRDRLTGEIVGQHPPEELLRFWAAARGEERLLDLRT
ncbi:MAG: flagellar protein FlaG [Geminicoccaceae bacterium]|nr:flagellar protein FlaG [Geminicoccaceae bacterium]